MSNAGYARVGEAYVTAGPPLPRPYVVLFRRNFVGVNGQRVRVIAKLSRAARRDSVVANYTCSVRAFRPFYLPTSGIRGKEYYSLFIKF